MTVCTLGHSSLRGLWTSSSGSYFREFVTNSADLRNLIEENESRLHSAHPTPPTSKKDASDEENPEVTAVDV